MGKKLTIGIISAIAGLSVVGGVCYNTVPSFKTAINDIFKNKNNKANIGFDKPSDDNTDSAIKPIEPSEFLKTYKYELPTSFLGGQLYVKVLSNNNLLVSSSVTTSILICNAETAEVTTALLSHSNWKYFYELDSGNCLISSTDNDSGLALYNTDTNTIEQIYDKYQSFSSIEKSPTGSILLLSSFVCLVEYNESSNSCNLLVADSNIYNYIVLSNGDLLYSYSYTSTSSREGIYLVKKGDSSPSKILSAGSAWHFYILSNGNCLMSSSSNSCKGLYLYKLEDRSLTQLKDTSHAYVIYQLTDNKYLIHGNGEQFYLLDISDYTFTEVYSTTFLVREFIQLNDIEYLVYGTSNLCLFNIEDNSFTLISSVLKGPIYIQTLENGNLIITSNYESNSSSFEGIYLFDITNKALTQLYTQNHYWNIFCQLSNGNCLIGSTSSTELLLYDSINGTIRNLLTGINLISMYEQEDGTYLIKTNDFNYEYDCVSDTIKLVYTVTE